MMKPTKCLWYCLLGLLAFQGCGSENQPFSPDEPLPPNSSADDRPDSLLPRTTWVQIQTATLPPARALQALAYDSDRERLVLFGGSGVGSGSARFLNDTWEYDGQDWTEIETANRPPAREFQAQPGMVYDGARRRMVLFGGGPEQLNDTWEYDGNAWVEIHTDTAPPARRGHTMAYDAKRQRIVLFGGFSGSELIADTWDYDGTNWTRFETPSSPSPRAFHSMAYDLTRERVVLFSGSAHEGKARDTWEFTGTAWIRSLENSISLSAREYHAMAYDLVAKTVVLFGGQTHASQMTGDYVAGTFDYDGVKWTQIDIPDIDESPEARALHSLVYHAASGRIILFGGVTGPGAIQNDLWELQRPN